METNIHMKTECKVQEHRRNQMYILRWDSTQVL